MSYYDSAVKVNLIGALAIFTSGMGVGTALKSIYSDKQDLFDNAQLTCVDEKKIGDKVYYSFSSDNDLKTVDCVGSISEKKVGPMEGMAVGVVKSAKRWKDMGLEFQRELSEKTR